MTMHCRHCGEVVSLSLIDLGSSPPSNAYLTIAKLSAPEVWYPLRVLVCQQCWLAQTEDYSGRDALFDSDYAYFSSFSTSWLQHAERYVSEMIGRFDLRDTSMVVEVAANDGYLLQYVRARGIPCFGIEPTASTAAAARARGIEIIEAFFGQELAARLARSGRQADLIAANNVLAHVPDINDFLSGFTHLLKTEGVATFEFPHLLSLVTANQFDTIYHEHYSYLSLIAVERIFSANGLRVFDVEMLPTHGGSLRVFACRSECKVHAKTTNVDILRQSELDAGMNDPRFYRGLQERAEYVKDALLTFLIEAKRAGKKVGGYGAAAKGNTLLNFAGIRRDLIPWVVDRNPAKQGKYLPGSRIPIVTEETIRQERPNYILILPWNLRDEIKLQLQYAQEWKAGFVVAIPHLLVD